MLLVAQLSGPQARLSAAILILAFRLSRSAHAMFVQTDTNSLTSNDNGTERLPVKEAWEIPPSSWQALRHPRAEEVAREVDAYFLEHWKFSDARGRATFLKAGFSHVTCLYFPLADDDRIRIACRLLTVLFLVDGRIAQALCQPSHGRQHELTAGCRHAREHVVRRWREAQQQTDRAL